MRGSAVHYITRGPGLGRVRLSGGRVIEAGARVRVARPGWFDKVGTYKGRDRRTHRLMVQFAEHGNALLFCTSDEVTAILATSGEEQGTPSS